MTSRCLVLRNAAQVRERFFLPFHFEKRNGTGLRTSSLRSKRNDEGNPAAWVCSVSFVPGFFRSDFFPNYNPHKGEPVCRPDQPSRRFPPVVLHVGIYEITRFVSAPTMAVAGQFAVVLPLNNCSSPSRCDGGS